MSPLSPSGARIRGDDYQHLFAWCQVLRALRQDSDISAIGVEDLGTGNVDDVTVYHRQEQNEFYQVKSSVDARRMVNFNWLTTSTDAGGPSMLKRFYASWLSLAGNGQRPRLGLVTNRPCDPSDPIIVLRDGRDGTVAARLSEVGANTNSGRARRDLGVHLGIEEAELIEFLRNLHFRVGKIQEEWSEQAEMLMYSLGLRSDQTAIQQGISTIRGWVTGGKRQLSIDEIQDEVATLNLRMSKPVGVLLVQAIERDLMPENATVALDWVDLYQGDEPRTRRRLHDNRLWNKRLRPEIQEAARILRAKGYRQVLVKGYMRLPSWFTVGTSLGDAAGFEVTSFHGTEEWASTGSVSRFPNAIVKNEKLGTGQALAVGVSLATNLSHDVVAYLTTNVPEVGRYVCLAPEAGPHNRAITNGSAALGWAINIRDHIRVLAREYKPDRLHLFLATPTRAALLLGHFWDRLPDTQLYEDQGSGHGYLPSFFIPN